MNTRATRRYRDANTEGYTLSPSQCIVRPIVQVSLVSDVEEFRQHLDENGMTKALACVMLLDSLVSKIGMIEPAFAFGARE